MRSNESFGLAVQGIFEFCGAGLRPAAKPERLFFALMPDESSAALITRFAERLILENDLAAQPVAAARLHIALFGLGAASRAALYGAKLVGQTIGAAGLSFAFDGLGSQGRGLALTSSDPVLAALQGHLGAAIVKNGLRIAAAPPAHVTLLAHSRRQPQQSIAPLAVKVSGLALLRREEASGFQVLRRWPLNKPSRLVFTPAPPLHLPPRPQRQKKPRPMAITVYGIKNCDTMKKAFVWLETHGIAYDFHDYKKLGVTKAKLTEWCKALGCETVLNRAGPSFRKLPDEDKEGLNQAKAIGLMMTNPSMIKRPLLDTGAALELGFKPERYSEIFKK